MPVFSPNAPSLRKTLCGLSYNEHGYPYSNREEDKHEKTCNDCITIQGEIDSFTNRMVEVDNSGKIIKPNDVVKVIRERFGISSRRARLEISKARTRKIKEWGGAQ